MDERVERSDKEWRSFLSEDAYRVTRRGATERPHSHPGFPDTPGTLHCVCCNAPLFHTADKFESGTGWPSFTQPASDSALREREDRSLFMQRTEVLCSRCDAHLGHVFPDGPPPTGLRYCINGVALIHQTSE